MLQKLPMNNFELIEDAHKFNEDFIKKYNEDSDEGYILLLFPNILKNYMNFIIITIFT